MRWKARHWVLGAAGAVLILGVSEEISAQTADLCKDPILTIELGPEGILNKELEPESAGVIDIPGGPAPDDFTRGIKVENITDNFKFDVTFVMELTTAQLKEVFKSTPRRRVWAVFKEEARQVHGTDMNELACGAGYRCELTLRTIGPRDNVCFNPWILALAGRELVTVNVLNSSGDRASWGKPSRPLGYIKLKGHDQFQRGRADFIVPLGDTGIESWRYLNPLSPAVIFKSPNIPPKELEDLRKEAQDYIDHFLRKAHGRPVAASPPGRPSVKSDPNSPEGPALASLAAALNAAEIILDETERVLQRFDSLPQVPAEPFRNEALRVSSKAIQVLKSLGTADPPPVLDAAAAAELIASDALKEIERLYRTASRGASVAAAVVARRAVEDLQFIQERSVRPVGRVLGGQELEDRKISFDNTTADRQFEVSFVLENEACNLSADPEDLRELERQLGGGLKLAPIPEKLGECKGTISIPPNRDVTVDARVVAGAPGNLLRFTVDFFEQIEKPARPNGYIALTEDAADREPENKLALKPVVSVASRYDPSFGEDDVLISEPDRVDQKVCNGKLTTDPRCIYTGDVLRHYAGTGRLDITQNFGNRADASLSLQYKAGDLGVPNENLNKITASQYQANVYATNFTSLNVGKRTFAEPSRGIAVREAGEGGQFTWKWIEVTHILKRESASGIANDDDEDHDSTILQIKDVRLPRWFSPMRRLSISAVRGEERLGGLVPQADGQIKEFHRYRYETVGMEAFFKLRSYPISGSIAGYRSERDSRSLDPEKLADGRGDVGLLTIGVPVAWKEKERRTPVSSLTAYLGLGDGDDPDTKEFNEGYIGEGGKFVNDQLFLRSIGDKVSTGGLGSLGGGLSNKRYLGIQYTDSRFSVLGLLANLVGIQDEEFASQTTLLSIHNYRFREEVFGDRDAGWEYNLDFRLESPKGVKWSLGAAYFQPGNALDPVFQEKAWSLSAGVSVEP